MRAENITVGCDPEIVVVNPKTGAVIPAWEIVSAKKGDIPLSISTKTTIHADGVALEFNMTPTKIREFGNASYTSFQQISKWLKDTSATFGQPLVPSIQSEVLGFSKEILQHPQANVDGCDVDYCAYNKEPNVPRERAPINSSSNRYFGGHIHLGYDSSLCPPWAMARFMDLFVYLPMMAYDPQPNRRAMYGLAGLHRPKPYGMEYRTPSNFWLSGGAFRMCLEHNLEELFLGFEKAPKGMNDFFNSFNWDTLAKFINRPSHTKNDVAGFRTEVANNAAKKLGMEVHYL